MAKRTTKKTTKPVRPQLGDGVEILNAGSVLEDPITSTLETNYMPYAMSVIVSRALPEIDGFKPAHRKLLYTMYGSSGTINFIFVNNFISDIYISYSVICNYHIFGYIPL